ncbi:TPM domain-containing protein [filamentous cyanobacterium LEGE 11480]|uniref:TPM domain-containing protein n=1 Tax=Romeriopsis navalis LEGE 11480 TaxID=2777977 RepID=A0A928VMK8_9CYAN|nr:TPM domain-containing protein [Romeriopsis navalis]MBE9029275.1 TPM domain-containing protein [Romeriopsis navalis LEGE 11480]
MHTLLQSIRQAGRRGLALLLSAALTVFLTTQFAAPAAATGVFEMPETAPEGHILDQSDLLSRLTEGQINSQLNDLAAKQQQNVTFVTMRRLDYGETIDTFTQQLFERWYPDAAAQANQTLLVIDTLTNNTSIVQGEQAQAAMSPEIATSVAQETVLVPLKYGNRYNQAFLDASDRISTVLSGGEDPGAPEVKEVITTDRNFATPEETKESNAMTWVVVLLVLSTAIPMATYYFYQYMGNR